MLKTHNCGELRATHVGQEVTLAGWVNRRRDQGGLIFIDVRDRWGITQATINAQTAPEARVTKFIRDYLYQSGFVEIDTPILFKTTPEGARDYLVPSRVHPGKFYALPQSPQQLKQLLMVAGYEKYFQIARCFRDEDQRGDRQPEFTQLDLEMSFVEREDVMTLIEGLMVALVGQVTARQLLTNPFPRITHKQALEKYGTDKPDLRYGLEIVDIADIAGKSGFQVFVDNVAAGKWVRALKTPGCGTYSRKQLTELEDMAKSAGAKGPAWMAL